MVRHLGVPAMEAPFSLGEAEAVRGLLTGAGFREVAVERVVRTVRFPSPAGFVRLMVMGAAAAVPALGGMAAAARDALVDAIREEVDAALRADAEGEALAFPLEVNVARARA